MRRVLLAFGAVWVVVGGYGLWSYVSDYYVYRGFGPPRDPSGVVAGRLEHVRFWSSALDGERSYDIYLPAGYAAAVARGQRFGVLYLLHGSPGWPKLFFQAGALGVAQDTALARRQLRPFLIVAPDGRDGTVVGDTEWADTPHGNYESFVLDVVHAVDRRWPTSADRAHRVLAGNSMGAYAAANLALRRRTTFGAFEVWSGYFTQTRTGVFEHATAAELAANSPLDLARAAGRSGPPLRANVYVGASDPDAAQLRPFVRALRANGTPTTATVLAGGHDWRLWRAQTPAMLRWAGARLGPPR